MLKHPLNLSGTGMVLPSAPVGAPPMCAPVGVIPTAPMGAPVSGLPGQMPVPGMAQFLPGYTPGFPGTAGGGMVPTMYHQTSQIPGLFNQKTFNFHSYLNIISRYCRPRDWRLGLVLIKNISGLKVHFLDQIFFLCKGSVSI